MPSRHLELNFFFRDFWVCMFSSIGGAFYHWDHNRLSNNTFIRWENLTLINAPFWKCQCPGASNRINTVAWCKSFMQDLDQINARSPHSVAVARPEIRTCPEVKAYLDNLLELQWNVYGEVLVETWLKRKPRWQGWPVVLPCCKTNQKEREKIQK